MKIEIPGYKTLQLDYLVMDYNGTLAVDGCLIDGVREMLAQLSGHMQLHVLTADTFGGAAAGLEGVDCRLSILPKANQSEAKREYVESLGADRTVAMGNGRNDRLMLKAAELAIAVILEEGASVETVMSADVVCRSINSALELLLHPLRLTATLRS